MFSSGWFENTAIKPTTASHAHTISVWLNEWLPTHSLTLTHVDDFLFSTIEDVFRRSRREVFDLCPASVFKPPAAKHALMPCVPRVHPSSMHRYACGCSSRPLWHSSQQIRPPGEYLYIEFVLKVSSRLFSSSLIFAHIHPFFRHHGLRGIKDQYCPFIEYHEGKTLIVL